VLNIQTYDLQVQAYTHTQGGDVWSVFARFCQISDTIGAAAKKNGAKLMEHPKLGTQFTCFTGTKVQILTLQVVFRLPRHLPVQPWHWYAPHSIPFSATIAQHN